MNVHNLNIEKLHLQDNWTAKQITVATLFLLKSMFNVLLRFSI